MTANEGSSLKCFFFWEKWSKKHWDTFSVSTPVGLQAVSSASSLCLCFCQSLFSSFKDFQHRTAKLEFPVFPLISSPLQRTAVEGGRGTAWAMWPLQPGFCFCASWAAFRLLQQKAKLRWLTVLQLCYRATNLKIWKQHTPDSFSCFSQPFKSELLK